MAQVLRERQILYETAAEVIIETYNLKPQEVVELIIDKVKEGRS